MLLIRCVACKQKLFKYLKVGHGSVLRCYKERILKSHGMVKVNDEYRCPCGNVIGSDKPGFIQMRKGSFYFSGHKV